MKCLSCGQSMVNTRTVIGEASFECRNSRCVKSVHHKDARCDTCDALPVERTNGGTGFTVFLCENGHSFTTTPR